MSGSQALGQDGGKAAGTTGGGKHTAGAFDVRSVIAALIGVFGVVLVVVGLVDHSASDLAKAGGVNANLWAGIGMVVVALVFGAWVVLRPLVVPETES